MLFLLIGAAMLWGGVASPLRAQMNELTAQEKSSGWILLFNGRDMSGWIDPRKLTPPGDAWTIEDGCLKALPHPAITEDLLSEEKFGDFEFVFDWRIAPAGNSGVKYRIQDHMFLRHGGSKRFEDVVNDSVEHRPAARPAEGQDYVIGFEYQLIDNARADDAKTGPLHAAGAVYDMIAPARDATRPVGEFNHSRVVIRGTHVEHWLNGVKVVDGDLSAPEVAARIAKRWGQGTPVYRQLANPPRRDCPISLQNHGAATWFRNLKIRRLERK